MYRKQKVELGKRGSWNAASQVLTRDGVGDGLNTFEPPMSLSVMPTSSLVSQARLAWRHFSGL